MDFLNLQLNFNYGETLPGYEARAAFTVNSATMFKEDVDIVPTIVDRGSVSLSVSEASSLKPVDLR